MCADVETAGVGEDVTLEFEDQQHRRHLVGPEPGTHDQKVHAGRLEAEGI